MVLEYQPQTCRSCGCVLNPFVYPDYKAKFWTCWNCQLRNPFPPAYAEQISEVNLPPELVPDYSTVEYDFPETVDTQIFMYVVDTAIPADELAELKDSIQQSLNLLPPDAFVGLITYGRIVFAHELGFSEFSKSYAFDGTKLLNSQSILEQLGVFSRSDPRGAQAGKGIRRFILPVSECEFMFNTILDDMQSDPWPVPSDERPLRAAGSAALVGLSMLESLISKGSRMIMFIGGAVTAGPGQIAGEKKVETLRSHLDMTKGNPNTKYILKATKFYETLAEKACSMSAVIDLFICSLDQVGLLEMKSLAEKTGGNIVMADSCKNAVFKKSFVKLFERDSNGQLKLGTSASINILCSKGVKICGMIGHGNSQKKKTAHVSDVNIGIGGTSAWTLGGVDKNSTIAFFFEITNTTQVLTPVPIYLQLLTRYLHSSGHFRLRVTTIKRMMSVGEDMKDMIRGFDQEAAAYGKQ